MRTPLGSSPHTRGARRRHHRIQARRRIIPAYAGSTTSSPPPAVGHGDHPRIRGEHIGDWDTLGNIRRIIPAYAGSTIGSAAPAISGGIIPAYAGSTWVSVTVSGLRPDHPRIRGEHLLDVCDYPPVIGSSPHTRGAPRPIRAWRGPDRIIPAYAGSTVVAGGSELLLRDHPRIRGEHTPTPRSCCGPGGSSPHTRGAPSPGCSRRPSSRIIPAYAGSTSTCRAWPAQTEDHPRIRGEHLLVIDELQGLYGSSPHTRGARCQDSPIQRGGGIIPAYAGSTADDETAATGSRDHPRIRGEHGLINQAFDAARGSSPHTRGARLRPGPAKARRGIIPAYAGSTSRNRPTPSPAKDHPRIRGEHE